MEEIGAAAWEAAVAWAAVGSVFLAAATRAAVAVTLAVQVTQAGAEVIPAQEEDIRLMAAKGDIPTMILAVAVRVR